MTGAILGLQRAGIRMDLCVTFHQNRRCWIRNSAEFEQKVY